MKWQYLVLLASAIWSFVNINDKYLISNKVKNNTVVFAISGLACLFYSLSIYFFSNIHCTNPVVILLCILNGIITSISLYYYIKAVQCEDISKVIPLFYLSSIFTVILAVIFLDEILSLVSYIAICMIIFGAILLNYEKNYGIKFNKAFYYLLIITFLIAISQVLNKYLLNYSSYLVIFSYSKFASAIVIMLFCLNKSKQIYKFMNRNILASLFIFFNEILFFTGVLLVFLATSYGEISIIEPLSSTRSFFVIIFSVLISKFFPKIFKEDIQIFQVSKKIGASVIMLLGVFLLT